MHRILKLVLEVVGAFKQLHFSIFLYYRDSLVSASKLPFEMKKYSLQHSPRGFNSDFFIYVFVFEKK